MPSIVTVNVSQNIAPTPSTLQRTGAFLSQGATTTTAGARTLLTQASDLTAVLKGALANTSITFSGGTATVTTTAPHGYTISDVLSLVIAGTTPTAYNGTWNCTITGASTFTFPITGSPTTPASVPGTWTPEDVGEIVADVTTFFAQGSSQSVYVLELGAGTAAEGVAYLTTWIAANPGIFYGYLVPDYWDGVASFLTLMASFEAPTAKTYFWIKTTSGTYAGYTALMKCAVTMIEAPATPAAESSLASAFRVTLNYNPSSTNKVTPLAFSYLFGVTPYPTPGNGTLLTALKNAGVNVVGTGSEGGISTAILLWGTTMDVRPFNYWYSVDWVQINVAQALANEIINGSNNPTNPLYLNQDGINRLQVRTAKTMGSAVTFGLALGTVVQSELNSANFTAALEAGAFAGQAVVNAVPFVDYYTANPSDYKLGVYNGLSITYIPLRGFESITVNLVVSDFVSA